MANFRFIMIGICIFNFQICSAGTSELVELKPYHRGIVYSGFTRALREMTVSSEVSGRCDSILVEEGDEVQSPGVIAKLDSTFVELELEKNGVMQEQAKKELELNDKTVARYTTLTKKDSVPVTNLENAALASDINRLTLKRLKIEEKRLQELLGRHTLYGPPGWRVTKRVVEPGEYVTPGQPVLHLGDFRHLLVKVLLTYEELHIIQQQESVKLHIRELQTEIEGAVFRVSPEFDELSNKIAVDILLHQALAGNSDRLRSGLHAQLEIEIQEEGTFVIASRALLSRYESYWLMSPSKKKMKVFLLGRTNHGKDAIVAGSGLAAKQMYLSSPLKDDSGAGFEIEQQHIE